MPCPHASGARLCEALNRSDLAELLGTPGEIAKSASGRDGSVMLAGGKETATPSARVEFGTYTVTLTPPTTVCRWRRTPRCCARPRSSRTFRAGR
ncbi:DUF6215 domain-containing protein [Streptomyces sp. LN549]|uniref:DUF6215 domain-containing protein n=1 Tax=Streptomyces sp. LN549 TaxID=3112979 RepID=UPI003715419B